MPELPEVETVRQTLRHTVLNQTIQSIEVIYDNIIEGDSATFLTTLTHQTIREVDRYGKYLIFIFDRDACLSHLRMEGKYLYVPTTSPRDHHTHLIFHLENGYDLRYHDVRKFGRLQLVPLVGYKEVKPLNQLGKEPFDITPKELQMLYQHTTTPIKTALLDQSKICGIGNIYANEILYACHLHPLSRACDLSIHDWKNIVKESQRILNAAIQEGGTTIRSFSSGGIHGLFSLQLNVYGKENETCLVCGKMIQRVVDHQRSSYFCPKCQKKKRKRGLTL